MTSWRAQHRDRVRALEAEASAVMLGALGGILDRVAASFAALRADAADAQARGSVDDAAQIRAEWQAAVIDEVLPYFADVYQQGADQVVRQVLSLGGTVTPVTPELLDHAATEYLQAATPRFFRLGNDAWDRAHSQILAGFEQGEDIATIRRRIQDVTDLARAQAEAMARTEVIAASNLGAQARVDLMGADAPPYKQWLATLDARTRPTHRHADGQVVPHGTAFEVGGARLQVPGDPSGPAAEVVNCRCTVLYIDSAEPLDLEGRQVGGPDVVTAAAGPRQYDSTTGEEHTGSMLALVPADPGDWVMDGGESADTVHLTLAYLGDAADIPVMVWNGLTAQAEELAAALGPVAGRVFGASVWNPSGDSPALVLNVGDQPDSGGMTLGAVHDMAATIINRAARDDAGLDGPGWMPPEQHSPWVAHVCLAYGPVQGFDPVAAATRFEGPIMFDTLRLTYGGQAYDYALTSRQEDPAMDSEQARNIGRAVAAAIEERTRVRQITRPPGVIVPASLAERGQVFAAPAPMPMPMPKQGDCPPGHHQMPDGTCMPDQEMDSAAGPAAQVGEHLRAVMHVRGESTGAGGTGRRFINTDYREPPFAYNWQLRSSAHGGVPEVAHVGNVTRVVEDGPTLYAFGNLDLDGVDGEEYARRLVAGIERWVSIGLDETRPTSVTLTLPDGWDQPPDGEPGNELELDLPMLETIDGGRVGELTGVSVPAQADATVEPTQELINLMAHRGAMVASVVGSTSLPVGDRDRAWDGGAAAGRVFDAATGDGGKVDTAMVARAFLYRDPEADPATKAAWKLGFADVVNGQLQIIPKGVAACAGGRGVNAASIPDAEKSRIRSKVCTLYGKVRSKFSDWPECPFAGGNADVAPLVAAAHDCGCGGTCDDCENGPHNIQPNVTPADVVQALTAASLTITLNELPPARWFEEPDADMMAGALMMNDQGRLWGLLAPLGTGHRAFVRSGRRVEVPTTQVDYSRFLGAKALTDAGMIAAGPLTMDCGHAPMLRGDHDVAPEHYENSCSVLGKVNVGYSARLGGVWIAGALEPGTTPDRLSRALACRCSGDWQPHPDRPGWQELVAALLVPAPGFGSANPAPASSTLRDGVLVASSTPVRYTPDGPTARPGRAPATPLASAVRLFADHAGRTHARRVLDAARPRRAGGRP